MRRYENYKPSGIPWIEDVPNHWNIVPNRSILKLKKSFVGETSKDYALLSLTKQGVIPRDMENLEGKVPASFDTYQVIEQGDLIFCLFDIDETPRAVGISDLDGMITSAYTRFTCDPSLAKYTYYFYLAMDNNKRLKPLYTGLRKTIQKNAFLSAKLPLPPLEEQRAIVRYLDKKLEQIDTFIQNKRRLIALLEEQKSALINRAVTKGLDEGVKMKDSGVKWLKKLPKHWEEKRAKYYFKEIDERSATGEEELLSVSHKTGVTPRSEKNITMFKAESYEGYKLCQPGDLVINIMWAWMGAMGVSSYTGIVSSSYGVYRQLKTNLYEPEYLDYLIRVSPYVAEYNVRSTGVTSSRARMYTDDFFDMPFIRPPLYEQKDIVSFIKNEAIAFDRGISNANQEIHLINEYRTTLISEVVTGKIDVRTAA